MKANKVLLLGSLIGLTLISFNASATSCGGGSTPTAPVYGGGCENTGYVFDRAEGANGAATSDVGDLNMKLASYSETTYTYVTAYKDVYKYDKYAHKYVWVSEPYQVKTPVTTNYVLFQFKNYAANTTSITDLYFGGVTENLFTNMGVYYNSRGTYFTKDNPAMSLPDVTVSPFDVRSDYSFGSVGTWGATSTQNGVNSPSEYVTVWGLLSSGQTYNSVFDALSTGSLKVGLELTTLVTDPQYCNNNAQQIIKTSYLNRDCVTPVPVPAAAWLFGSALIGFVTVSNRRRV